MKIYQNLIKMMYLNNDCTDFKCLVVMVCVTNSPTKSSFIIFNFPLVFKNSLLRFLLEFMSTCLNYEIYLINSYKMSEI